MITVSASTPPENVHCAEACNQQDGESPAEKMSSGQQEDKRIRNLANHAPPPPPGQKNQDTTNKKKKKKKI